MTDAPSWVPPDPSPPEPDPPPAVPPDTPPPVPSAPVPIRTNRLAIAATACAVLGLVPLALGFGIAALVRLKDGNDKKGRQYAVSGVIGAGIWVITYVVIAAMAVNSMVSVGRDDSGRVRKSGVLLVSSLRTGDCFFGPLPGSRLTPVSVAPCTKPHNSEVTAVGALPAEPYPGEKAVDAEADRWCGIRSLHLGRSVHGPYLISYFLTPEKKAWENGDRKVICTVHYTGPGTLTTPIAETIGTAPTFYADLKVGDCFEGLDPSGVFTVPISCADAHRNQVYATYTLPLDGSRVPSDYPPYPGTSAVKKKASRFCKAKAKALFGKRPPPVPVRRRYILPDGEHWDVGIRTVVCLATTKKPLKRSLLPK
ncbi:septum formation family protein [Actinomadura chokoriensis]|uniref:septum formation family protein n=1 Tax=Actinomadura chokoriensis TaxID=454156 RepID=UPI0031FA3281